ncbi:alpha/beta hydrolase [Thalassospira profundimaris]|uniref:Alpha/beta hydrolase n=2 Tax=Thalassospira TaxID=168934 RepID=A0A367WDH5_9PROT|nr:alpha/beta hydrolase [Thalassospira profundimaris]
MRLFAVFAFLAGLSACAPKIRPAGPPIAQTSLETDMFRAADGTELPLQHWGDVENPDAVILALHGMGDYANAFMELGDGLGKNHRIGIAVYAFDQRGFGRSPSRPFWAGISTMVNDASDVLTLLRARYPGKPVYLLGNSMGGAVAIVTAASRGHLMDGLILVAPAVWNRDMMPWYQTASLAVMSHSFPWLPLTGKGLDIWPSDNIEMLRRLSRDPNMMSSVRVDLIAGVADIMDLAHKRAVDISVPTLLLSGAQDQVIPPDAVTALDRDLAEAGIVFYHRCLYDAGYHMLLRDLNGPVVIADIGRWIAGGGGAENYSCTQS